MANIINEISVSCKGLLINFFNYLNFHHYYLGMELSFKANLFVDVTLMAIDVPICTSI